MSARPIPQALALASQHIAQSVKSIEATFACNADCPKPADIGDGTPALPGETSAALRETVLAKSADDLMNWRETCVFFGGTKPIDISTLRRWVRKGRIPQPIKFGPRFTRWRRGECQAVLDRMTAEGSTERQ